MPLIMVNELLKSELHYILNRNRRGHKPFPKIEISLICASNR